ncbi:helix-turn-helix domain-containing protein [Paenibacillus algorifonticola]|uniref:PucR family transcriptional regulator n=1 Tax=Paenibacillus algorifonticola TaxID=684063 RepID=UPI003D29C824
MSTTEWLKPLERILDCPVRLVKMQLSEWNDIAEKNHYLQTEEHGHGLALEGQRVQSEDKMWVAIRVVEHEIEVLEIEGSRFEESMLDLLSLMLRWNETRPAHDKASGKLTESEKTARSIGEWIQEQFESGEPGQSMPDHLTAGGKLFADMIPFLLVTEYSNTKQAAYVELEKLLRSFLAEEILLIPLREQEWLIWGPVSLLKEADSELFDDNDEESVEDNLASICLGLHEMLASEWIGECHLAVSHPIRPAKGIVETTAALRETINLGRKFHVGSNIHFPWNLQLERLLNSIPESQRARYLEQSLKRTELFVEAEMLATLETFFSLDCNVSETAKKLYIHRNTLLYRLDKLKQETGLDVRQFRDAVLVKIILLLYKVTKRH